MNQNTGLYTARRMSDGQPVTGYLLRYGRLFTFIVEKDAFEDMCIGVKDEENAQLRLVRVKEKSVKPLDEATRDIPRLCSDTNVQRAGEVMRKNTTTKNQKKRKNEILQGENMFSNVRICLPNLPDTLPVTSISESSFQDMFAHCVFPQPNFPTNNSTRSESHREKRQKHNRKLARKKTRTKSGFQVSHL